MNRYQILIEYVGTNFIGWQIQSEGQSVQKLIQTKISKLLKEKINLVGSGRTDSGVHAIEQSAHFDCKKKIENLDKFLQSINYFLNLKLISITHIKRRSLSFHARFSAKQKTYVYKILDRRPPPAIEKKRVWHIRKKLNDKAMKKSAKILVGKHDFTSFRSTECQANSALKTIDTIKILRVREEIQIWIKARSFLHNQVRIIAGTLVLVGRKKWKEKNIKEALKSKKRAAAGQTAPAEGLYLLSVKY